MKLFIFLHFNACALTAATNFSMPLEEAKQMLDAMYTQATTTILENLDAEEEAARERGGMPNCTRDNIDFRQKFGSMKKEDRKAYTTAVLCLQSLPAFTPSSANSTGMKSRFDDFILTHFLHTPMHHFSGTFLAWHRYYIWIYSRALLHECNYNGPIPYWDWSKWASSPQTSPIINGDEYSMGGNGEFIPGRPAMVSIPPVPGTGKNDTVDFEIGLGGGCVMTGSFANMSVNLGPKALGNEPVGPDGGLGITRGV